MFICIVLKDAMREGDGRGDMELSKESCPSDVLFAMLLV